MNGVKFLKTDDPKEVLREFSFDQLLDWSYTSSHLKLEVEKLECMFFVIFD